MATIIGQSDGYQKKLISVYRDAENYKFLINSSLDELEAAALQIELGASAFGIDVATGHQLEMIGLSMGFGKDHCGSKLVVPTGYDPCTTPYDPATQWVTDDYVFADDEIYRSYLKALAVKSRMDYTESAMQEGAKALFGPDAMAYSTSAFEVTVNAGRALSTAEMEPLLLAKLVLPIDFGIGLKLQHGSGKPFGFGLGWGGFCSGAWPSRLPS